MLRLLVAVLVMFATIIMSLELIAGPTVPVDLLLGRMYWLPVTSINELPNIFAPVVQLFPVLTPIPFIVLLAAGLLSLLEMD